MWELSRGAGSQLKQRGGGERGGQRERERVSEQARTEEWRLEGEERRERVRKEADNELPLPLPRESLTP